MMALRQCILRVSSTATCTLHSMFLKVALISLLVCYKINGDTDCRNALIEFDNCVQKAADDVENTVMSQIERYSAQIEKCFTSNGCDSSGEGNGTQPPAKNNISSSNQDAMCRASIELKRQSWVVECVSRNNGTAVLPEARRQPKIGARHRLDPRKIRDHFAAACRKSPTNVSVVSQCIFKIFEDHKNETQEFNASCIASKSCKTAYDVVLSLLCPSWIFAFHRRNNCREWLKRTVDVRLACERSWTFLVQNGNISLKSGLPECQNVTLATKKALVGKSTSVGNTGTRPKRKAHNETAPVKQNKTAAKRDKVPLWVERPWNPCGAQYFHNEYLLLAKPTNGDV